MSNLNKKLLLFCLVLILSIINMTIAGDVGRIGTAAGVQLQQPVGARDLALGGANIAFTNGIDALYWNPAGFANMESPFAVTFTKNTIFNDIDINYLGLGVNAGALGAIAFDIKSFSFGDVPLTTIEDMDGSSGATFSPTWATLALTYANKLTNNILVGIKGKLVYESIPRASGSAFAFDLGIQYKNLAGIEGISFAVVLKNIGTNMKYSGSGLTQQVTESDGKIDYYKVDASSDQLPTYIELGVGYKYQLNEKNSVLVAGLFQNNNVEYDAARFGIEYDYDNFLALRTGYNYTIDMQTDEKSMYTFTVGGGIKYKVGGVLLGLDYVFRDSAWFNANNMFTLKVSF